MSSNTEKRAGRSIPHPRIVANERYLANPDIVRVGNPHVNPAREMEHFFGHRTLSSNIAPSRTPLRRV